MLHAALDEDVNGRLSGMLAGSTTVASATYGVAGEMLGLNYCGYYETRTYNSMLQMTRMTGGMMDMQYVYAAGQNNGRITQAIDGIAGAERTRGVPDAFDERSMGIRLAGPASIPTPIPSQSFLQRLIRGMIFLGLPMIVWKLFRAGPAPILWRGVLTLILAIQGLITALVFAAGEQYYYRAVQGRRPWSRG